jgi:hypothetical protein
LEVQKLFNVMSVASFVMPALTKHYMSELTLEMTKVVTNMVPGKIDEVMPELPTSTGPAVPFKIP